MGAGNGYTNPYEQSYYGYQQQVVPPKKKKNRIPGIILLVMGAVFLCMGFFIMLAGIGSDISDETQEPGYVFWAENEDEYSCVDIQYMTDSVAYLEEDKKLNYYIVCDREWTPAVICVHDDELAEYRPYIDWLYSDSYENEPQQMTVAGHAKPFDAELAEYVMEGFEQAFGEGIVDKSNFSEWFGEYYLEVGQEEESIKGLTFVGIFFMAAAVIMLITGIILFFVVPASAPKV